MMLNSPGHLRIPGRSPTTAPSTTPVTEMTVSEKTPQLLGGGLSPGGGGGGGGSGSPSPHKDSDRAQLQSSYC